MVGLRLPCIAPGGGYVQVLRTDYWLLMTDDSPAESEISARRDGWSVSKCDRRGLGRCALGVLGVVLAAGMLGGCKTTTSQARKAEPSGFLGDYSQLREGQGDEALLVYVNPRSDFRKYRRVMLDPVRVYAARDSALAKLPKKDLQSLVNYLDAALREQLKSDYVFVGAPGPDVMRLRVAITEAKASKVALDVLSTVMPPSVALSMVKNLATGSHSAVGSAGVECEALDSTSNVRLFAAVDARVGRKITGKFDKLDKWHAVTDAFDYWAARLQTRLSEERNAVRR